MFTVVAINNRKGILEDIDKFDAKFFGYTPKEAKYTDPQHRIWLETVWTAFENAGKNVASHQGMINAIEYAAMLAAGKMK